MSGCDYLGAGGSARADKLSTDRVDLRGLGHCFFYLICSSIEHAYHKLRQGPGSVGSEAEQK